MNIAEQIILSDLNDAESLREYCRQAGGEIRERDDLVLMTADHPHFVVNSAFVLNPELPGAEIMRRAREFYSPLERTFAVFVPDHLRPGLSEELEQRGALRVMSSPALTLSARTTLPALGPDVQLRLVDDERGREDFVDVATDAWATYGVPDDAIRLIFARQQSVDQPHLRTVVAYLGDQPAAAAQVVLSHGIAGIYWVSTASTARRRGLAEACTAFVGNLGFDLGARLVSLQASPMGEPIYRRMGYVEITRYSMLLGMLD